jgi:hypothetical protein
MKRDVHLEMLLGTRVWSREGRPVGRIEEFCAGPHGEILEFHVGEGALLERLSAMGLFQRRKKGYRIRWDQIDWTDLTRPRLTCGVGELRRI